MECEKCAVCDKKKLRRRGVCGQVWGAVKTPRRGCGNFFVNIFSDLFDL